MGHMHADRIPCTGTLTNPEVRVSESGRTGRLRQQLGGQAEGQLEELLEGPAAGPRYTVPTACQSWPVEATTRSMSWYVECHVVSAGREHPETQSDGIRFWYSDGGTTDFVWALSLSALSTCGNSC